MSNPILVEVSRGPLVESWHRGAVAVADANGRLVLGLGETGAKVFPRSAIKILQAIPLIESGAAEAFGFGNAELALAQASHNAEPWHVEVARGMLTAAGLEEQALECGAHEPLGEAAARALIRAGVAPTKLHNNCSGKHAGMLATARYLGEPHAGYVNPEHPVQRRIAEVIAAVTGVTPSPDVCGCDGCSVPTWALPLDAIATGFARMATRRHLPEDHAEAAKRLMRAATDEPFYIAGTGRFCTRAMEAYGGRVYVKTGAEGVFCAALPTGGLGIAVKIDDGGKRAAELVIEALLVAFLGPVTGLAADPRHAVRSVRGRDVGEIRLVKDVANILQLTRQTNRR